MYANLGVVPPEFLCTDSMLLSMKSTKSPNTLGSQISIPIPDIIKSSKRLLWYDHDMHADGSLQVRGRRLDQMSSKTHRASNVLTYKLRHEVNTGGLASANSHCTSLDVLHIFGS